MRKDAQAEIFSGLKVIEMGMAGAGPMISSYLCHYGATVIRVESSRRIDIIRTSPPYWEGKPGINRGLAYANYNANKLSMLLDLKHERGIEIFRKLAKWADVFVENYRAGTLKKLGLAYENLKPVNENLVMLSTSTQGQTGTNSNKVAGFGLHVESISGFVHLTGSPDREPCLAGGMQTDYISGKYAVAALIAALIHRNKTGHGQYIDMSHIESSLYFLAPLVLDYTFNGRVAERASNQCPYAAPHNVYPCKGKDKWCTISIFSDEEWDIFLKVSGNEELIQDRRCSTVASRKQNEAFVDEVVGTWTMNHSQEDVLETLQKHGICSGIVKDAEQSYRDPQMNYRGHWKDVIHSEIGTHKVDTWGFRLSEANVNLKMSGPALGEHTAHVCSEILGLSDEEFIDLEIAGVFQ